ncbi:Hypothetical predicted protein [Octopus vulgaris]|uniref:Uncharacterized protein n=1 Tax=Octopus vulgaris TaxID=6645 RepID=A0AA36AF44_OCTVU|nr:Hypothetical predicted protein [Octopus vulgaris]
MWRRSSSDNNSDCLNDIQHVDIVESGRRMKLNQMQLSKVVERVLKELKKNKTNHPTNMLMVEIFPPLRQNDKNIRLNVNNISGNNKYDNNIDGDDTIDDYADVDEY